jgi:hypothetical protein
MDSSHLSADLILGVLTPAPAVRPLEEHSPNQDAQSKARRCPRPEDENHPAEESSSSESVDRPAHQLDDLA